MRLDSGYQTLASSGSTTGNGIFHPMTRAIGSEAAQKAKFIVELTSAGIEVQPGLQYSTNGVDWSDPAYPSTSSWGSTQGMVYGNYYNIPSAFTDGTSAPTENLFVRFGLWCRNKTGSVIKMGSARLWIVLDDVINGSVTSEPTLVYTGRSTAPASAIFTPMTGALPVSNVVRVRATTEMRASTGDIQYKVGYQMSDDGHTWVAFSGSTASDVQSADGITYGTSFTDISSTINGYQYVRFGAMAYNKTGSDQDACLAAIRVDWRGE